MRAQHTNAPTLFPDMQVKPQMPSFPADVTANRHKGNAESVAANPSELRKRESHERILELLRQSNLTSKEIAARLGVELHTISGRFSELRHQLKLITTTGTKRDGAAVLRVIQ